MNNLQRGIYQPLADKVPIYDLADEDPEEERSRAPLLVVIALVVLAAFAGVVYRLRAGPFVDRTAAADACAQLKAAGGNCFVTAP